MGCLSGTTVRDYCLGRGALNPLLRVCRGASELLGLVQVASLRAKGERSSFPCGKGCGWVWGSCSTQRPCQRALLAARAEWVPRCGVSNRTAHGTGHRGWSGPALGSTLQAALQRGCAAGLCRAGGFIKALPSPRRGGSGSLRLVSQFVFGFRCERVRSLPGRGVSN